MNEIFYGTMKDINFNMRLADRAYQLRDWKSFRALISTAEEIQSDIIRNIFLNKFGEIR